MTPISILAKPQNILGARTLKSDIPYEFFLEKPDEFKRYLELYVSNPVFRDAEADEVLINANPYRRPVRSNDIRFLDFTKPLKFEEITSYSALAAHRVLINIYDSDLVFLPYESKAEHWEDFAQFYKNDNKVLGEIVRPVIEKHVFGFLDDRIRISGNWSKDALLKYFEKFYQECKESQSEVVSTILSTTDKERAAIFFLVQLASDFLSEASAMARNVLGNYGPMLSELFKVLVDEYGYGVYETKHSTLFESTMKSCGLNPQLHTYWQFYLASSLSLVNYFHYVSRDHSKFFRYLGALYYTEVSLISTTQQQSQMLRTIFGSKVDTRYFDEHTHIDEHHGRMSLEKLITPAIDKYGEIIIEDIIRGFEEFRLLQEIADNDFITQIKWADNIPTYRKKAAEIYQRVQSGEINSPLETFVEVVGERSTTHVHDEHRLLVIESGEMDFWPIFGEPIRFKAGDVMLIPCHRLHGSVVQSDESVYHQPEVLPAIMTETQF